MSINTPREYKSLFEPADAQTETDDDTETNDTDTETVEIPLEEYEKVAALQEIIDIKADSLDDADIDDIWIAGFPLGKLVDSANTRSRRNNAKIEEIESNGAEDGGSSDAEGGVNDGETSGQRRKSGIEQVCGLPDEMARKQLTKNIQRARYIALRIKSFGQRGAYDGIYLKSDQIRRILDDYDDSGHTETVSRVMSVLEEFADGESVSSKILDGTKHILFDSDLAERLSQIVPEESSKSDTRVVIGGRS